jgi:CRP-like cAMP-binding protein
MTGTVAARLSAQPFFAVLTDSQRGALAGDGTAVTFAAGERLFDEGGVADTFWLIEHGGIALDMRVPGRGDQIVETLGLGQTVSAIFPVTLPDSSSSWALTASARLRLTWRCTRSCPESARAARASRAG